MVQISRFWAGLNPLAKGACLFIVTLLLFSVMDSIAKSLTQRHHAMQVVWARYTSQTVIAFVVLSPFLFQLLRTKHLMLQFIRSAFLFCATMCFFTSLKFMDMASTTAIFEISPLFLTAAGFFILKEKVGPRRWIGVFIGLIGAMVIIRPRFRCVHARRSAARLRGGLFCRLRHFHAVSEPKRKPLDQFPLHRIDRLHCQLLYSAVCLGNTPAQ